MSNENMKPVWTLTEWMDRKFGTTKEYWDLHLSMGALIRLRKLARLRKEYEEYEEMVKEKYGDYFYSESEQKTVSLTRKETYDIIMQAVKDNNTDILKIDNTKAIKKGYIQADKIGFKTVRKFTPINTITSYLEGLTKKKTSKKK